MDQKTINAYLKELKKMTLREDGNYYLLVKIKENATLPLEMPNTVTDCYYNIWDDTFKVCEYENGQCVGTFRIKPEEIEKIILPDEYPEYFV